ncbi:MAG: hypothetical protein AAGH92_06775 [Planctomycetota bacterium]
MRFTAKPEDPETAKLQRELAERDAKIERLQAERRALNQQLAAMYHPPIFLNTLPKSGSVFIVRSLQRGLGTRFQKLGRGTFPVDMIDGEQLAEFRNRNAVSQEHVDASAYNLTLLGRQLGKLAIHLRDPRAASYSWMHHLTGLMRDRPEFERQHAMLCPELGYHEQPETQRMDWVVQHHFPACIRWIQDWIAVADGQSTTAGADGLSVYVTTYERFVADADGYFAEMLEFFGVAPARFQRVEVEKSKAMNFRKGQAGEWRGCGDDLVGRMTEQMPDDWFDRFGWPR